MFRRLTEKIITGIAHWSADRSMRKNPWTGQVLAFVHNGMMREPDESTDLFLALMHSCSAEAQESFIGEVSDKLSEIERADDQRLANRQWLLDCARQSAFLQVLSQASAEERDEKFRHPCLFGMEAYREALVAQEYAEVVERTGSIKGAIDEIMIDSAKLILFIKLSMLVAAYFGDETGWFPRIYGTMMAMSEAVQRERLGLSVPCDPSALRQEVNALMALALDSKTDGFDDVPQTRPFADWRSKEGV